MPLSHRPSVTFIQQELDAWPPWQVGVVCFGPNVQTIVQPTAKLGTWTLQSSQMDFASGVLHTTARPGRRQQVAFPVAED